MNWRAFSRRRLPGFGRHCEVWSLTDWLWVETWAGRVSFGSTPATSPWKTCDVTSRGSRNPKTTFGRESHRFGGAPGGPVRSFEAHRAILYQRSCGRRVRSALRRRNTGRALRRRVRFHPLRGPISICGPRFHSRTVRLSKAARGCHALDRFSPKGESVLSCSNALLRRVSGRSPFDRRRLLDRADRDPCRRPCRAWPIAHRFLQRSARGVFPLE